MLLPFPGKPTQGYDTLHITQDTTIQLSSGAKIHITKDGEVEFEGMENIKFKCHGEIDFDATAINMHAKSMIMNIDGPIYNGSSEQIIWQAPRLDFCPIEKSTGYFGNIKEKVLMFFRFVREK